jgi:NAD(P)-dependent dehydrogenase (short-subunit alcohol dehydrogenase family)
MTALDGKVILLTGATDGMGRALAADLAREGATVLVHGRDRAHVTVNALHPATFMPTKVSPAPPVSTIAQGVEATLRLITAPPAQTGTGRYFNGLEESRANDQAYDLEARRRLRVLSARLTGR